MKTLGLRTPPVGGFRYKLEPETTLASALLLGYTDGVMLPVDSRGTSLVRLGRHVDHRGGLTLGEIDRHLPFTAQRFFFVDAVPQGEVRGEHAHRQLEEFLVCVKGSCTVRVDDGTAKRTVVLDSSNAGLYLPPRVWCSQSEFSKDALLLVLASRPYDPDDYWRDYGAFLTECR